METPTPYAIVCSKKVNDPKEKEKKLHAILQEERINPNREFFRVSKDKVFLLFDLMDGENKMILILMIFVKHLYGTNQMEK